MDKHLLRLAEAQFAAKEQWRQHRAASLTFPEKVRIVAEMQRRRAPILAQRGLSTRVWPFDEIPSTVEPSDGNDRA